MSGSFTHYLNDQLVEEPKGWRDFTQVIERNEELRFIGLQYEGSVTFHGQGFERMKEIYNDSSCQIIAYRVTQDCGSIDATVFEASIIISEIEWNINRCTATTTVADSSYGSYIINNAEIKLRPTADFTKTGEALDPCPYLSMVMFEPVDGDIINYGNPPGSPGHPIMWDWADAMEHTLRYISDNNITGIESDWYNSLQVDNGYLFDLRYAITSGYLIRNVQDIGDEANFNAVRAPIYDFAGLWQNMWKKYDLWSAIEVKYNGDAVLRIEPRDYFFGSTAAVSHDDQDNLIQGTDLTQLYGRVKVGSETTVKGLGTNASIPFLLLVGFTEEEYHIPINCNTSAVLDLITSFIIDSNVIERTLIGNDDAYDDDVFMVEHTASGGDYFAFPAPIGQSDTAPYSYNRGLMNDKVMERLSLLGAVQYITQATDGFYADTQAHDLPISIYRSYSGTFGPGAFQVPTLPQQHRFAFDYAPLGFDTNGNYGNGTPPGTPVSEADSRYTASQQGLFGFSYRVIWQPRQMTPNIITTGRKRVAMRILIERYDAGNVYVDTPYDFTGNYYTSILGTFNGVTIGSFQTETDTDIPVYMNAGDYVVLKFQFQIQEAEYISDGANSWDYELRMYTSGIFTSLLGWPFLPVYWSSVYVAGQGGEIIASDPEDIYQNTFKYVRHIPLEDWLYMVSDPTAYVEVGPGQVPLLPGYARRLARNVNTGNVEIELISATPNSFLD